MMSHSRDGPGVTAPLRTNIVPLTAAWDPPLPLPPPLLKFPKKTHKQQKFHGIFTRFWGGFCLCVFIPMRNDPPKHINKLLPPTQSGTIPQICYVYVFFSSLTVVKCRTLDTGQRQRGGCHAIWGCGEALWSAPSKTTFGASESGLGLVANGWFPKGWSWQMFLERGWKKRNSTTKNRNKGTERRNDGSKNRNEGTFAKPALS